MKTALLTGLLLGALHGFAMPAEAHNKDRVKLVCKNGDCTLSAVSHGHNHHHTQKTKIKFTGDVCRYKPVTNVTVCRY